MPSSGVQTCARSEEHTSELQSHSHLVCRLLLEKKKYEQLLMNLFQHSHRQYRARHENSLYGGCSHLPTRSANAALCRSTCGFSLRFFFNDTATTEIYTLSLHDALPI